ncbi:hypothetical protein O181_008914 [Austropuccinia psidii MF-1]|uniref:Uncharacterized protein n=1 Tax=Austropuccinia psidii MF-1 TaxID=1389203 RepID=A0A9Q3BNC8_9BASI|nr:hypothetical protein [Austropuccinia psidii MF-1]
MLMSSIKKLETHEPLHEPSKMIAHGKLIPHTDASQVPASPNQPTKTDKYLPSDHDWSSKKLCHHPHYLRNSVAVHLQHFTLRKTQRIKSQHLSKIKTHHANLCDSKQIFQEAHP